MHTTWVGMTDMIAQDRERDRIMDNWRHRSNNMRCATCMYFVPKQRMVNSVEQKEIVNIDSELGRCRRRAPTANGFPVVFLNDWCGDHKLDENKI